MLSSFIQFFTKEIISFCLRCEKNHIIHTRIHTHICISINICIYTAHITFSLFIQLIMKIWHLGLFLGLSIVSNSCKIMDTHISTAWAYMSPLHGQTRLHCMGIHVSIAWAYMSPLHANVFLQVHSQEWHIENKQ